MTDMDPRRYYDELGENEWERLAANPVNRMEFSNTVTYLERDLPATGRVLDAGGGPGRYTIWLAERGHEVEHVDLSDEQVRLAHERVAERDLDDRVRCRQGDIRDLPFDSSEFDAVCCLGGPISHILDPDERSRALAELRRVAKPGAPVFVSVMGRLACLAEIVKHLLPDEHGMLAPLARTGDYDADLVAERSTADGWAEVHFFRADEFEAELEAADLRVRTMVGLEGLASNMQPELADAPEDAAESVETLVTELREDPAIIDISEHMFAVCRAPDE